MGRGEESREGEGLWIREGYRLGWASYRKEEEKLKNEWGKKNGWMEERITGQGRRGTLLHDDKEGTVISRTCCYTPYPPSQLR